MLWRNYFLYCWLCFGACVNGCVATNNTAGVHRVFHQQEESRNMAQNDIRVIVFDFGRVLGGTDQKVLVQRVQKELNISHEKAFCLVRGHKAHTGSEQEYWRTFSKNHDVTFPKNWPKLYSELKIDSITLNKDVAEIVKNLHDHGYILAILSNTTAARAERIQQLGGYKLFDLVLLSFEMNVSKPDEKAFRLLLDRANASPEQCLFIDDNQINIQVASGLGFKVIQFESHEQLRAELKKMLQNGF